MNCPRCDCKIEIVSEYFDFLAHCLVRDYICSKCNSAIIEKFFNDSSFKSEWIDLNVEY